MSIDVRQRRIRTGLLGLLACFSLLAGCNDNNLGLTKRRPNLPPVTRLSSGPPDSTYGTSYKVHMFWSGGDPDGTIDHYDFILLDHPAIDDSISTADPNAADRVTIEVPAPDDPRWTATTSNDTTILSIADTLRRDPVPPPGLSDGQVSDNNRFVRMQNFERWHTFFIRAVDNEGAVDPTPDYRSFNSTTLAPTVALKSPVSPALQQFQSPPTVIFNWDGLDPVGDGTFLPPIASRWVMIPTHKLPDGSYEGYPRALYAHGLPWSEWHRWDASDQSGVRAIVRGLLPVDGLGRGFYLFAVQAMDEAGAVTPVFDATTSGQNNAVRVLVRGDVGATLVVDEKFLGTYSFVGGSRPVILSVAAGQPVSFRWRGDASSYGGSIVAYRYGWNIRNPANDEEWEQNWCEACRSAPTRIFNSGTQRFFLETRDNAETITHAEIELGVNQVTRTRDLLYVDDSIHFQPADDAAEEHRWVAVIDSLRARRPFTFDPARDLYDVAASRNQPPPLSLVFDYKAIVWTVRKSSSTTALTELAAFFDPFVEGNRNAVVHFNYLSIYVDNGGKFWLSGQQPTEALWVFGQGAPLRPYPINITNWDDYASPHPDQDSVGVASFLWKMGAEAVDVGGGGRGNVSRDRIQHYCIGFRRATPQGFESQRFTTTTDVDHQHVVAIQTADVDNPPAGGVTYTTETAVGHTHTLTLTQDQLLALARGEVLPPIELSVSDVPRPHTHTVTLVDQTGLWGAPARLDPETALWAQPNDPVLNPPGGRPAVEIYNMPAFMGGQQPPLRPDPNIWVALYSYVSPTPADPGQRILYPVTADGMAAILLRKAQPNDAHYSRALCGFEVFRLRAASHRALAENILLRHFRLGLPDPR